MPQPEQKVPLTPLLYGPDGAAIPPEFRGKDGWETEPGRLFPPGQHIPARMPAGSSPRNFPVMAGQNVVTTPRSWAQRSLTSFEQLRALADFDLVRIAIEDAKGQILGMGWDIVVRERFKDDGGKHEMNIQAAKEWLECPDPLAGLEFRPWLMKVLEEIYVTDALTLYPRFTRGGKFIGLEQADGATIIPLVDERGRPPLKPAKAYVQIIYGTPETAYDMDELWYLPRAIRPNTPYGRSPVEYVMLTVNLAIRQQLYELNYYTEGTLPDSIFTTPENWDLIQIKEMQEWWDLVLSGKLDRRAGGMRFLPGGQGAALHEIKSRQWQYEFDEWLARVISWAVGVSPMPVAKVMNRATAEQMEASAMESGVRPIAEFVSIPINRALQGPLGFPELEFRWDNDETEAPQVVYTRNVAYVESGIKTLNEVRREEGEEPYAPEIGDRPFVMTGMGPKYLDEPTQPEVLPGANPKALEAGNKAPKVPSQPETPPPEDEKKELKQWLSVATKRARMKKKQKAFETRKVSFIKATRLRKALNGRGSLTVEGINAEFAKAERELVGAEGAQEEIRAAIADWLRGWREEVKLWALKALGKADVPISGLEGLVSRLTRALSDGFLIGNKDTVALLGIDLHTPDKESLEYAQERAAEMVGMKWVDGELVENPNSEWAITDSMREAINSKVSNAIEEGWSADKLASELDVSLGDWRAETIARTETGIAYNHGAAVALEEGGAQWVEILDGAGCLPLGHDDAAPKASGNLGVVELESQADGQVWTLDQFREYMLGHPNCVRAAVVAAVSVEIPQ